MYDRYQLLGRIYRLYGIYYGLSVWDMGYLVWNMGYGVQMIEYTSFVFVYWLWGIQELVVMLTVIPIAKKINLKLSYSFFLQYEGVIVVLHILPIELFLILSLL